MNSLIIIVGSGLLGVTSLSQEQEVLQSSSEQQVVYVEHKNITKTTKGILNPFKVEPVFNSSDFVLENTLLLEDIDFIDLDTELELDFDTEPYLPVGFNPYKEGFDLNQIPFEDINELGEEFGISNALPADFDPYAIGDVMTAVNYIEEEEEIVLGFDTSKYLPEGFDPYKAYDFLATIEYIDMEDNIDLGFDTSRYLPKSFDPHKKE